MLKSNVSSLRGGADEEHPQGEPMSGDEVFEKLRRMGVPMIDLRTAVQ